MKKLLDDNILEELLDVTYTIMMVYDELYTAQIMGDDKQYQQRLEELEMCTEIEDKIYQRIPCKITNFETIINRINYLNNQRKEEEFQKEMVLERIQNYLINKPYLNPFLSMQESSILKDAENELTIYTQYCLDYTKSFHYLTKKEIEEEVSNIIISLLTEIDFTCMKTFKIIEKQLQKNEKPILEGRDRCVLFGQNEDKITKIYNQSAIQEIINGINSFLVNDNYAVTPEDQVYNNYLLVISVKATLSLLDKEEQEFIWQALWEKKILNENTNKINNMLLNIFHTAIQGQNQYQPKNKNLIKN